MRFNYPARATFVSALLFGLAAAPQARADVHTVFINEYSTQCNDGSTDAQYVELLSVGFDNLFRQCASIQVKRTVGGTDVFFAKPVFAGHGDAEAFPTDGTFLIATPAFAILTGLTPDLLMPNGTLHPAGGVIRFAADSGCVTNHGTIHEVAYGDQGAAPAPGPGQAANLSTRTFTFSVGARSPRTYAGATASSWNCGSVPVEPRTWGGIKSLLP
jgi:hypothetical protein